MPSRMPVVVLLSGFGSNLQAIIDQTRGGRLPIDLRAVISDRADAYGLERAREAGIPARVVTPRPDADRQTYDAALAAAVSEYEPGLVVLAGFMRILGRPFLPRFEGRTLNVHPSLLPRHRGLHTHRRALEAGDRIHGSSVHFVTEELDSGPVIVQVRVPVLPDDDAERLSARVKVQEHIIYPQAIRWFATGRVAMHSGRAWLDGLPLAGPVIVDESR